MPDFHKMVKLITPPLFPALLVWLKNKNFVGNYASWDEALQDCPKGINADYRKELKNLSMKVKNGLAEYSRDLTLFYEPQFNWPLLATLFKIANTRGSLGILDLGGALGNVYFQHRKMLTDLKIRWCIVDVPEIVDIGRKEFQDDELIFYESISDCATKENINIALLSGTLQYLRNPEIILDELLKKRFPAIIVDRTPFIYDKERAGKNRLTIQKLPREMGYARVPHWFFDQEVFCTRFYRNGYRLIADWRGFDGANIRQTEFKGFIFEHTAVS